MEKETRCTGWETMIYLSGTVDEVQREIDATFSAYPVDGYRTAVVSDMISEDGERMTTLRRDSNSD